MKLGIWNESDNAENAVRGIVIDIDEPKKTPSENPQNTETDDVPDLVLQDNEELDGKVEDDLDESDDADDEWKAVEEWDTEKGYIELGAHRIFWDIEAVEPVWKSAIHLGFQPTTLTFSL